MNVVLKPDQLNPNALRGRHATVLLAILVSLAGVVPFLSCLNWYFMSDDFGVVQFLFQRPPPYVFSLFTHPWTDSIYGVPADELRPTVALAFQVSSLLGSTSPIPYHAISIAVHGLNILLVFAIARQLARLSLIASGFAAILFAVLPIHAETLGWLQGMSDSVPTLFYIASFLAYAMWRKAGLARLYWLACILFFLALFSKQSAITMLLTLLSYDILVEHKLPRFKFASLAAYLPFLLLTTAYLIERRILFGNMVREAGIAPAHSLLWFGAVQTSAVQELLFGGRVLALDRFHEPETTDFRSIAALVYSGAGLCGALLLTAFAYTQFRRAMHTRMATIAQLIAYFGPIWWLISTIPLTVTYDSPRHLYLASVGVTIMLGLCLDELLRRTHGYQRRAVPLAGIAVVLAAALMLQSHLAHWNTGEAVSRQIMNDITQEASIAPTRSLVVLGAPAGASAWSWALPFAVQPPFADTDLRERLHIIYPLGIHCCQGSQSLRTQWLEQTRETINAWANEPDQPPAVALSWDSAKGTLTRQSESQATSLRPRLLRLLDLNTVEEMQSQLDEILHEPSNNLSYR
ncbi:MAG TPA: hypothetical protein VK066_06710 [Chloroflexota bacterium]|nr:hypothetical protein [Chloroflexota bacterium]